MATGDTGVAAVTAGPGFANGLIGLVDAATWSVPAGDARGPHQPQPPGPGRSRRRRPAGDRRPDREVGGELPDTGRIPRYVAEALHRARSGCPGAVYLEIDSHAMYGKAIPLESALAGYPSAPSRGRPARPHDIGAAVAALAAAERPVIVAGSGAFWSGAGAEIGRFAKPPGSR